MSLIQEALKRKTEDSPVQSAKGPAGSPAPGTPPPAVSMPRTVPVVLFLILLALVLLASIGVYLLMKQPASGSEPAQKTQAAAQPAPVPQPAPPPVPAPKDVPDPAPKPAPAPEPEPAPKPAVTWPEISFSGTAAAGDKALAIINGRMLSKGDTIDNLTVLQIGTNKVLLEYQGEKRIFRLD